MFIKCRVIVGSADCGKSCLMNYIILYTISKGLKVEVYAMQACRAVNLVVLHLHKKYRSENSTSMHCLAELAITKIIGKPNNLKILQMTQTLFIDKLGQVSTEILAVLDIILRKVRNSHIYLGELLVVDTLDHKQLTPIKGTILMISLHIFTSFEFLILQYSVRVSGDPGYQRRQNIAHLHPRNYK